MPNLTDYIEEYLKRMLALSSDQYIEIKRRELAGKFSCVPSQINYVLQRRFSPDRGYLVEGRRGGGGCIRIYRVNPGQAQTWRDVISIISKDEFDTTRLKHLLSRMNEEKLISKRESALLEAIIREEMYAGSGLSQEQTAVLKQRLFGAALEELLKSGY